MYLGKVIKARRILVNNDLESNTVLVTTVPGLEDLVVSEVRKYCPDLYKASIARGRIIFKADRSLSVQDLYRLVSNLMLAEKIYLILCEYEATTLKDLRRAAMECKVLEKILSPAVYYAVKATRVGVHDFTSLDIADAVGDVLSGMMHDPPVSLDDPDVLVYAELIHDTFRIGIDLTPFKTLRERGYREFIHPSMLNPIVARAMCRLAGIKDEASIIDPMCGSGTIVIEAMLEARNVNAVGMDVNKKYIRGARENAIKAGVSPNLLVGDVRRLKYLFRPCSFDAIVTNPPYGIREKAVGGMKRVYHSLLEGAANILIENGRLVILTPYKYKILESCEKTGVFKVENERRINLGGLMVWIIQLRI